MKVWRDKALPALVAMALVVPLVVAAVRADGFHETKVSLNDAGVWVVRHDTNFVGRVNTQIGAIEVQVAGSEKVDVQQVDDTVLMELPDEHKLVRVDVAQATAAGARDVPAQAQPKLGGPSGALLDPGTGSLWVVPRDQLVGVDPASSAPVDVGVGADMTVGLDGIAHAYSPEQARITSVDAYGEVRTESVEGAIERPDITAVGSEVVLLDQEALELVLPGGDRLDLSSYGAEAWLQQAGPDAGAVLVATDERLLSVPLGGGDPEVVYEGASGLPVPPVWLHGCAYGAWEGDEVRWVQACEGRDPLGDSLKSDRMTRPTVDLTFRVNRDRVVLNDMGSGVALLFTDDKPIQIEEWPDTDDLEDENTDVEPEDPEALQCEGAVAAPEPKEDIRGTRPGRPVIVRVLDNDQLDRCDVPRVEIVAPPDDREGVAAVVEDGTAIQVSPSADRTDDVTLTYGLRDGNGAVTTADVTVEIHGPDVNDPPDIQELEDGASHDSTSVVVGGSVRHNVLLDKVDPDGDALTLVDASGPGGTVNYRADGEITFNAADTTGEFVISYDVVDERGTKAPARGRLAVQVVDPDHEAAVPVARADRIEAEVGEAVTFDLLANDTAVAGGELQLGEIEAPTGLQVEKQGDSGEIRIEAATEDTWLFDYAVSEGTKTTIGRVRVDVREDEGNRPPVAVRDDVIARPGVAALVDLVKNDIDPDNDVLAVTSVSVPEDAHVAVEVIDLHIARITGYPDFVNPVEIGYEVSDGRETYPGVILVRPYVSLGEDQPPQTQPDSVSVRAGNATRIPVLENDLDPEGERLTLDDTQEFDLGEGEGVLFVYGDELRYVAPGDAERATIETSYTVLDPGGNSNEGEVTIDVFPSDPDGNQPPDPPHLEARVFVGGEVVIPVPVIGLDPEGDPVVVLGIDDPPSRGSATPVAEGFRYSADEGETGGTDSFTFTVRDALGKVQSGDVRVTVVPRPSSNGAPVAVPDRAFVKAGGEIDIPALVNDRDPDGDAISLLTEGAEAPTSPSIGEVSISDDGAQLHYVAPGEIAEEQVEVSMSYGIKDEAGNSARGITTIVVSRETPINQRPIARDDFVEPLLAGETTTVDVLANDYDAEDGNDLEVTVPGDPDGVVEGGDGTLEITVGERPMVLRYQVTDRGVDGAAEDDGDPSAPRSAWAFVIIPVFDQLPPSCDPIRTEVAAGETARIPVLEACTDPRGGELELVEVLAETERGGRVSLDADADEAIFVADEDVPGTAGFSYVVSNGSDDGTGEAVGDVTIEVTGQNRPPVFTPGSVELPADSERELDLTTMVTDPDTDDTHTFEVVGGEADGIETSISGRTLVIRAAGDARGTSTALEIEVSDGQDSVQGSIPVRVLAVTDPPPAAVDDEVETNQGEAVTVEVTTNDVDPYGEGLTVSMTGSPNVDGVGRWTLSGGDRDQSITFAPDEEFFGTATLSYKIQDQTDDPDRTSQATVRVNVIGRPSAPAAPTGDTESKVVHLRWSPPASNGAPITSYVVERQGGGTREQFEVAGTSLDDITVSNTTEYEYRVLARNKANPEAMDGAWSPWSEPLIPDQVPAAPNAPTLEFGDGSIRVIWEEPVGEWSSVTEYEIAIVGGLTPLPPRTPAADKTQIVWGDLTNGTDYTFTVRAKNDRGWSEPSPGSTDSPAGLPAVVSGVTASRLDENTAVGGALRVQWAELTTIEQNGKPFHGYIVDWWKTAGGSASSPLGSAEVPPGTTEHKVYQLDNGVDYTFSVRGVNRAGEGDAGVGLPANPAARPADLGSVSATPGTESGGQTAVVSFSAPDDRGEPINEVKFRVNGGAPVTAAGVGIGAGTGQAVEFTVGPGTGTPLSNGAPAQIDVRVCNEVGASDDQRCTPWASAPSVVPYGAPSAPGTPSVERVGDGRTLRWSWSEPANNGVAITAYEVSVDGGGWQRQGGGDRNYEQTFGYSQPHSLRVRAINDGPAGEKISSPSGSSPGTTADPPPPPTVDLTIRDDYLGGTWERSGTGNGTWGTASTNPGNGIRWLPNGTVVPAYCAESGASYTVRFFDGHTETWNWWVRIWGAGRGWVPAAVVFDNDGANGMAAC